MYLLVSKIMMGVILLFGVLHEGRAEMRVYSDSNPEALSSQYGIDSVRIRLCKEILSEPADEMSVRKFMTSINAAGSWNDINYNDSSITSWSPMIQLERLKSMAIAFRQDRNIYYNNKVLFNEILLGLDYYYTQKPIAKNWWFNQIGAPKQYATILLLLKGFMDNDLLQKYSEYLDDVTDNPAHRGANRIWVSEILIYKGCIEDSFSAVNKGFHSIASTLKIEQEQGVEGIKNDYSFHQHRAQLYSGGYGMSFAEGIAKFMALSAQTPFAENFTLGKRKLFSTLLLEGHQLFGFRDAIDFGTVGRGISRADVIRNIKSDVLDRMILGDPQHAADYKAWKAHVSGVDFPAKYKGNKYFWKSNIMTQHGANYYISAKVISNRTTGTEMLNNENLKGHNLPLGATNIMTSGNEYRDIFPVWDWTRIPGSTSVMNQSSVNLPWYLFGSNSFAGGVSDTINGIIAYEHCYNGVQARKAYFFVDGKLVCLGAGISAFPTQPVVTSVNQCSFDGEITFFQNDDEQTFSDSSHIFNDLKWVYHDRVGYFFPKGGRVTLQEKEQSGSWKAINNSGSDEQLKKKVFSLWINHGNAPKNDKYCYVVIPGKTLPEIRAEISRNEIVFVRNEGDIQAVRKKKSNTYCAVFYEPGKIDMGDGLQISSDSKVLLLIEKELKEYRISVADPTYSNSKVTITLNKLLKGPHVSPENGMSVLRIDFPQGDYSGSTRTLIYSNADN